MSSPAAMFRRVLPGNPFVGLRSYESSESVLFFGRRTQTLELLDRLHANRLVAVVGSSGCGKSSLVRAGLIPSLKAGFLVNDVDRWKIAAMKPGETPLYSLAAALTEDDGDSRQKAEALLERIRESGLHAVLDQLHSTGENANFLLLVDQFEEIFRTTSAGGATAEQNDDGRDFVSIMLRLAEQDEVPVYVVMSMRTDFLGDCDIFFGLPEALNRSQYLVPRLTRQQRREVIEGPVNLYQKEIEPELVDRLLNEAGDRSDQLPVLQHALMLTWREARAESDDVVRTKHYRACGGIEDALQRHAELAMQDMDESQQRLTESIFRMLTDSDDLGRRIRRPVRLSQLTAVTGEPPERVLDIVDRFRSDDRSFLIVSETETAGDQRIDISHEALFRQWKRLEGWVEAEAQSKELYLRLVQSARFRHQGREGLLLSPALEVLEEWRRKEKPAEAWAARYGGDFQGAISYLDASLRDRQRKRSRRILRRRLTLLTVFVIGAGLSGYFWVRSKTAERTALLGEALTIDDPLVRALVIGELAPSLASAKLSSFQQVATAAIPSAVFGRRGQQDALPLAGAFFEPNLESVITLSANGVLQRWNAAGHGAPQTVETAARGSASAFAFSHDRRWIAAGLENGSTCVAPVGASSCSASLNVPEATVTAFAFSPDDRRILAGYSNYTARIWTREGVLVQVLRRPGTAGNETSPHDGPISAVGFDPEGRRALTASWDGTAKVWDLEHRTTPPLEFKGRYPQIKSASFSADGKWVICGYQDGYVRIWSTADGGSTRLDGHAKAVTSVSFNRDASKVVTGSEDLTVRVWDLILDQGPTGPVLVPLGAPTILGGHSAPVRGVSFDAVGSRIVSASDDGTARVWSTELKEPQIVGKHRARVHSVAFSPDGSRIVSASDDKTVAVWGLAKNTKPLVLEGAGYVRSATFSPRGDQVVAGSEGGFFCLWDLGRGTKDYRQEDSDVLSVAFSRDGKTIMTSRRDGKVGIWPAETSGSPKPLLVLAGHQDWVWRVAFNDNGKKVATASMDKTARLWRTSAPDGVIQRSDSVFPHPAQVFSVAVNSDGTRLVTACADGKARLWDTNPSAIRVLREFRHMDQVWQVALSSDERKLLTASIDKTARIWNLKTGEPEVVFSHGSAVRAAAFQPGDAAVVTGAEDGSIRLWLTNPIHSIRHANTSTTACLTPPERTQYLGEREAKAQSSYEACETGHGRTPLSGGAATSSR